MDILPHDYHPPEYMAYMVIDLEGVPRGVYINLDQAERVKQSINGSVLVPLFNKT